MYYETILTLPANTLQTDPVRQILPIHPGTIQHVEVLFPPGCAALAHVQVLYWCHQLWPSNPDSFFSGNGYPISYDEDLQIVDPPYELELVGWNEDDTYAHHPILRVQVVPLGGTTNDILSRIFLGAAGPITDAAGG